MENTAARMDKADIKTVPTNQEETRWTKPDFWLCALHLFTLCSLAFAKPIFDVTGRDAAFFVVRGSRPIDIVSLVAFLCILVPGTMVLVEGLFRLFGRRAQMALHLLFISILTSVYGAQFIKQLKGVDGYIATAIIIITGISCAILYARTQSFRKLISLASPFILILPVFFIFGSQVRKIILPGGFISSTEQSKTKQVYLKEKPPIFFVIMDELPVVSLLDAKGNIDSKRFPNLAAFAETSYWFRNTTAVSPSTETAVPAILTGIFPKEKLLPNAKDHPNNLFTLLAGNYKLNIHESACYLCPEALSSRSKDLPPYSARFRSLIDDLSIVFLYIMLPDKFTSYLPTITNKWGNFNTGKDNQSPEAAPGSGDLPSKKDLADKLLSMKKSNRPDIFRAFISSIDKTRSDTFNFIHILLPHGPFEYLPSTSKYPAVSEFGLEGATKTNDKFTGPQGLVDQYHQLHLLQLASLDRLIGELISKLKEYKIFDKSLIVFVADHGASFKANDYNRNLSVTNAADIMFVPLLIKLPKQHKGEVRDFDAETIDVVPTIADYLDVELPWKSTGISLLAETRTAKIKKSIAASDKIYTFPYKELLEKKNISLKYNVKTFGLNQKDHTLFWFGNNLDLLGRKVSELKVKEGNIVIEFDQSHLLNSVDISQRVLPARIKGILKYDCPFDTEIAISVNGSIQSVTKVYNINGKRVFSSIIPETAFRQGANKVDCYVISTDSNRVKHLISANNKSSIYNLKNSDIISSDGTAYPIVSVASSGAVDDLVEVGNNVAISGWAISPSKSKTADRIVVFADNSFILAGRTTRPRPDVSKAFKNRSLSGCGFNLLLPSSTDTNKIRAFAISDKLAYELDYHEKFGVKVNYLKQAYSDLPRYELLDNVLSSSNGKKYFFSPEQIRGSVDIIKHEGNSIVIGGWAVNMEKLKVVDSILFFSKDRFIASGQTRVFRPDIEKLIKISSGGYFGFEFLLPSSRIENINDLRIFSISDGLASELTLPKNFN